MVRMLAGATPAVLLALLAAAPGSAAERFDIRLTPVPIEAATRADVTGRGSASAVLDGRRLTIEGRFEGLGGPATVARLHLGPAMGVRGPAVFEAPVAPVTAGDFRIEVELEPAAVEGLLARRLYLQLHSERAPDGNLWGWILQ